MSKFSNINFLFRRRIKYKENIRYLIYIIKKVFIKITISDEDFIFPITLYFTNKHTVLVRKRDFADKEHVISTIKKIIAWFINNESRKWSYIEEEKAKAKNNEQKHE